MPRPKARIQIDRIPGDEDFAAVRLWFSFPATEVLKWQRLADLLALVLTDEEKDETLERFRELAAEVSKPKEQKKTKSPVSVEA